MRRVGQHLQHSRRVHGQTSQHMHAPQFLEDMSPSLVERIILLAEDVKEVLVDWSEQSGERFAENSLLWFRGAVVLMDQLGFLQNGKIMTGQGSRNTLVMHANGNVTGPADRRDVNIWRKDFKFVNAGQHERAMG